MSAIDRRQGDRRTPGRRLADLAAQVDAECRAMHLRLEHPAKIAMRRMEFERAEAVRRERVARARMLVVAGFKYEEGQAS